MARRYSHQFQGDWRQVGVGHVAVVVGVLLRALRQGFLLGVIPATGFLNDLFTLFEQFDLAVNLVIYGFFDAAEAVEVLGLRSEYPAHQWH